MTAVLKTLGLLNGQLSRAIELDFREAICMEYYVCTSYVPKNSLYT